jgi:hypothetical protein
MEIDYQIYLYCIYITETTAPLYWHHTDEIAVDPPIEPCFVLLKWTILIV